MKQRFFTFLPNKLLVRTNLKKKIVFLTEQTILFNKLFYLTIVRVKQNRWKMNLVLRTNKINFLNNRKKIERNELFN